MHMHTHHTHTQTPSFPFPLSLSLYISPFLFPQTLTHAHMHTCTPPHPPLSLRPRLSSPATLHLSYPLPPFLTHTQALSLSSMFIYLTFCREKLGYMNERALGHPCIILDRLSPKSNHVLITSVSAYSVEQNGGQPPWEQYHHRYKNPASFRSFSGCQRYNTNVPPLRLVDGQAMPKPKASWVYTENLYVVPLSVIGVFTKSKTQLRMCQDSLDELMSFMANRHPNSNKLEAAMRRLRLAEPAVSTAGSGDSAPAQQSTGYRVTESKWNPSSTGSCQGKNLTSGSWRPANPAGAAPVASPSPPPTILPSKADSARPVPAAATTITTAASTPDRATTPAPVTANRSWASIAKAKAAPVSRAQNWTTASTVRVW
ncbi:hypothetical protein B0T14DRAFT_225737 [Immersiella caudata]|uniref:Uncharacterized protein n=1 Tax=Immersiella caudata TaxID=314043 RepID=A0AA39WRV3_9PEZI|nr:hypothetical protein B0T14DRAFT_225737 [Immersiella caudata]